MDFSPHRVSVCVCVRVCGVDNVLFRRVVYIWFRLKNVKRNI